MRSIFITTILFIICAFAPNPASASGEISLQGTTILRDGQPWIAKGVGIVGRSLPAAFTRNKHARAIFGTDELESAKQFGADLIRFQVSQGGSNPQSSIYSADYVKEEKSAVEMARNLGFSVIVCVDGEGERQSGLDERGMPNEKTQRAWRSLAPLFAADRGVMLELFNEPQPNGPDAVKPHNWNTWKKTMQPIVDEVRSLGAKNVLLVDGLLWAQVLKGAPQLEDPMSQIIYAVHPYYSKHLRNESDWDNKFGDFSDSHPVMATEWNATSRRNHCNNNTPNFAVNMLNYLKKKNIGLVYYAFDAASRLFISDYKDGTLTNYEGFHCGPETNFDAGELLARYFKGLTIPSP